MSHQRSSFEDMSWMFHSTNGLRGAPAVNWCPPSWAHHQETHLEPSIWNIVTAFIYWALTAHPALLQRLPIFTPHNKFMKVCHQRHFTDKLAEFGVPFHPSHFRPMKSHLQIWFPYLHPTLHHQATGKTWEELLPNIYRTRAQFKAWQWSPWYTERQGRSLKTLRWTKGGEHKRANTARFHFYETLEETNVIYSDQNQVTGCLGLRVRGGIAKGHESICRWWESSTPWPRRWFHGHAFFKIQTVHWKRVHFTG